MSHVSHTLSAVDVSNFGQTQRVEWYTAHCPALVNKKHKHKEKINYKLKPKLWTKKKLDIN